MTAVTAWLAFGDRDTLTFVPGAAPTKFSVTPGITLETVLLAELIGTPSTVSEAFDPVTAELKFKLVVLFAIVMLPDDPVVLLTIARRAPLASLMTLAVTPRFWPLIAAAKPLRVLFVLLTVTVAAGLLPTVIWKLPVEIGVLLEATGFV